MKHLYSLDDFKSDKINYKTFESYNKLYENWFTNIFKGIRNTTKFLKGEKNIIGTTNRIRDIKKEILPREAGLLENEFLLPVLMVLAKYEFKVDANNSFEQNEDEWKKILSDRTEDEDQRLDRDLENWSKLDLENYQNIINSINEIKDGLNANNLTSAKEILNGFNSLITKIKTRLEKPTEDTNIEKVEKESTKSSIKYNFNKLFNIIDEQTSNNMEQIFTKKIIVDKIISEYIKFLETNPNKSTSDLEEIKNLKEIVNNTNTEYNNFSKQNIPVEILSNPKKYINIPGFMDNMDALRSISKSEDTTYIKFENEINKWIKENILQDMNLDAGNTINKINKIFKIFNVSINENYKFINESYDFINENKNSLILVKDIIPEESKDKYKLVEKIYGDQPVSFFTVDQLLKFWSISIDTEEDLKNVYKGNSSNKTKALQKEAATYVDFDRIIKIHKRVDREIKFNNKIEHLLNKNIKEYELRNIDQSRLWQDWKAMVFNIINKYSIFIEDCFNFNPFVQLKSISNVPDYGSVTNQEINDNTNRILDACKFRNQTESVSNNAQVGMKLNDNEMLLAYLIPDGMDTKVPCYFITGLLMLNKLREDIDEIDNTEDIDYEKYVVDEMMDTTNIKSPFIQALKKCNYNFNHMCFTIVGNNQIIKQQPKSVSFNVISSNPSRILTHTIKVNNYGGTYHLPSNIFNLVEPPNSTFRNIVKTQILNNYPNKKEYDINK